MSKWKCFLKQFCSTNRYGTKFNDYLRMDIDELKNLPHWFDWQEVSSTTLWNNRYCNGTTKQMHVWAIVSLVFIRLHAFSFKVFPHIQDDQRRNLNNSMAPNTTFNLSTDRSSSTNGGGDPILSVQQANTFRTHKYSYFWWMSFCARTYTCSRFPNLPSSVPEKIAALFFLFCFWVLAT